MPSGSRIIRATPPGAWLASADQVPAAETAGGLASRAMAVNRQTIASRKLARGLRLGRGLGCSKDGHPWVKAWDRFNFIGTVLHAAFHVIGSVRLVVAGFGWLFTVPAEINGGTMSQRRCQPAAGQLGAGCAGRKMEI